MTAPALTEAGALALLRSSRGLRNIGDGSSANTGRLVTRTGIECVNRWKHEQSAVSVWGSPSEHPTAAGRADIRAAPSGPRCLSYRVR